VQSSPAVVDGVVYFGALDDNVYALKASTGEKIWNHTVRLGVTSAPAVSEGVVYISSDTYYLYALSAASGEEMWHFPTDADKVYASPAVSNGVLYVATRDGYFYAIVEPLTTPPPTPTPNPKEESFPIEWIIVAVAVLAVFGATLLVYFKKRKRYKVS
jgi:glucose dehydrogenase